MLGPDVLVERETPEKELTLPDEVAVLAIPKLGNELVVPEEECAEAEKVNPKAGKVGDETVEEATVVVAAGVGEVVVVTVDNGDVHVDLAATAVETAGTEEEAALFKLKEG